MNIFQKFYDLEKNAIISWFWDEGFIVKFGDFINGWESEYYANTWEEVEKIFKDKFMDLKFKADEKWLDEQTIRYEEWLKSDDSHG